MEAHISQQSISWEIFFLGEKSFFKILKNNSVIYISVEFCLGINTLDDVLDPCCVSILEKKVIIDVGCGDKFTLVLAADPNFRGPNKNLRNFQSQNFALLNTKWQNLIEFSHKKAVFINNLENTRKDSTNMIEIPLIAHQISTNLKKNQSVESNVNRLSTNSPRQNKKQLTFNQELMSKKQILEKSKNLIENLDDTQREAKNKEIKSYAQLIIPHKHQEGHHREQSSSSKKNVEKIKSLENMDEFDYDAKLKQSLPSKFSKIHNSNFLII